MTRVEDPTQLTIQAAEKAHLAPALRHDPDIQHILGRLST